MSKGKRHIWLTWIILLCFAAGQWAVYGHYHPNRPGNYSLSKHQSARTTVSEKCQLCDAMHHSVISESSHIYFVPLSTSEHLYKPGQYDFISISLVLASGRAPPVS